MSSAMSCPNASLRVIRTAIGTQKDSRENFSKLVSTRNKLMDTELELRRQREANFALQNFNRHLQVQNGSVMARVAALEAAIASQPMNADAKTSACQKMYQEAAAMRSVALY